MCIKPFNSHILFTVLALQIVLLHLHLSPQVYIMLNASLSYIIFTIPITANKRKRRCGQCERWTCGRCAHCLDMIKYGGPGKMKKASMERTCERLTVCVCECMCETMHYATCRLQLQHGLNDITNTT